MKRMGTGLRSLLAGDPLADEAALLAAAVALGASEVPGGALPPVASGLPELPARVISDLRKQIVSGFDPLGARFCTLRSPTERRGRGATYTPLPIVDSMLSWAAANGRPARVVDPGAGSGRFLLRAGRRFPEAELVGVEIDPVAAILAQANLAAAGFAERSRILLADYRNVSLPEMDGPTLFVGNPPYVRHHGVELLWKQWLSREAERLGHRASRLAGLHVHFFLATAIHAASGDFGCFITAAEWLDVNYGRLVRELFLERLGGQGIVVLEPTAAAFPDAQTTAAITSFCIGSRPGSIRFRRVGDVAQLDGLRGGRAVPRKDLEQEVRWSHLGSPGPELPSGFVELGELFRVHRGQVTGANDVWIAGAHSRGLPESVLFPSVTRARELLNAGFVLDDSASLRRVIDLPPDLSLFEGDERRAVERFLKLARQAGADLRYVARNRKAWWSVGLKQPAPVLATYMARRPPAFVRNLAGARHINIAHGLYPREAFSEGFLSDLVRYLSGNTCLTRGRTYAGGLTKFEPREMERIPVPSPARMPEIAG
jgi:adenine-specific DNA-methyltransferase